MTPRPDKKFYSLYALRRNYKSLQKSKEPIVISSECFWQINPRMLDGINYEIFKSDPNWINKQDFSPSFKYVYKELISAIECNNTKYTDEIIFVGMPWELEKANKYFGDAMLIDG